MWARGVSRGLRRTLPRVMSGLPAELGQSAFKQLALMFRPIPDEEIIANAVSRALRISRSIYDCMFASLASGMAVPLITAGKKLIAGLGVSGLDLVCYDIASLPAEVLR